MPNFLKPLFLLLLLLSTSLPVYADESFNLLDSLGGAEDDILEVDDAFQINYDSQPGKFNVSWVIAEGHYLYRDKMQITTDESSVNSKSLILPQGESK